ncbi:MAG: hypothetical protein ACM3KM_02700 [Acidobacteriaceae bacterium]
MEVTNSDLTRFIGGQIELKNPRKGYLYCGNIRSLYVTGFELLVYFNWMAEAVGFPPIPKRWIWNSYTEYSWEIQDVSDTGPDGSNGGRLFFQTPNGLITLFPPGMEVLDQSQVGR